MAENKKYIEGDFEFTINERGYIEDVTYNGPTGPGSVATIPRQLIIDGNELNNVSYYFSRSLKGLSIEKVVSGGPVYIKDMPILREVEINSPTILYICFEIHDCPQLLRVVVNCEVMKYGEIRKADKAEIFYNKPFRFDFILDNPITDANKHVIIGDEVENVGTIRGGHITLGRNVKQIHALKKTDFSTNDYTTIKEYELPTRIDFLSSEPPTIGSVSPMSISITELHVPAGAIDTYMAHPQWGKAAYFVDADDKTVDKYTAKHKARIKKLNKEREEKEAKEAEKSKQEKMEAMREMMHSTLGPQRLAKWNPEEFYSSAWTHETSVTVGNLRIHIEIPKDAPVEIYDKIVAKLESVEKELNR